MRNCNFMLYGGFVFQIMFIFCFCTRWESVPWEIFLFLFYFFLYISKLQEVKFGKSLRKIRVLCGCKKWCTRCKIRLSLCGIIISKCVTHRNGHTIKSISCTPNILESISHLWWLRKVSFGVILPCCFSYVVIPWLIWNVITSQVNRLPEVHTCTTAEGEDRGPS